jgi:hypothetical protein
MPRWRTEPNRKKIKPGQILPPLPHRRIRFPKPQVSNEGKFPIMVERTFLDDLSIIYNAQQSRNMFGQRGFRSDYWLSVSVFLIMLSMVLLPLSAGLEDPAVFDTDPNTPPGSGNWTISGSESYQDSVLEVNGNISISGSLILDNVTLRMNSSSTGPNVLLVENGGTLRILNGSRIEGFNVGSYFIKALKGSYFELNGSTINGCGFPEEDIHSRGIYTETDEFHCIDSTISEAIVAIHGKGSSINLTDTSILECLEAGIKAWNGSSLKINGANISSVVERGIDIRDSVADIDSIDFENCGRALIIRNSVQIKISDSQLVSNDPQTVYIFSSNVTIKDCNLQLPSFSGLVAEGVSTPSNVDIENSTFVEIITDSKSIVREWYRHDIRVTTNGGVPAFLADVEVKGPDGKIEGQGLTGSDGWIRDMPLISRIFTSSSTIFNEPHNLSLLFEGANRMKDFNSTSDHFTTISVLIFNPEIEFTDPENGTWLDTRSVTIRGTITDARPLGSLGMFLDTAPEVKLEKKKSFTIPLQFGSDGSHVLRIRAMNDDGKIGEKNLHFGIDTVDPVLTVDEPLDETFTSSPNITVSGNCEEESWLHIIYQGIDDLIEHTGGSFAYKVPLMEGWNDIRIKAIDRAGNSVETIRRVFLDQTPPALTILTPVNGTTIKNDFIEIKGLISHDTETLTVNGVEVDFDLMGFSYLLEDLQEGENRIIITARDRTGSTSRTTLWVHVDSDPPWIDIARPSLYTNQTTITVTGNVESGSSVVIGGIPYNVTDGMFRAEVDLDLGVNNITVKATDEVGNTRNVYIETILDLESPTFERIEPIDRSRLDSMVVRVRGVVFDDHGIKSVWGSNGTSPLQKISSNGTIDWVVMLGEGENVFTLEAVDLAGNRRSIELHYTYGSEQSEDKVPPQISITYPLRNETLGEGLITISGNASDDRSDIIVAVRIDGGDWIAAVLDGSSWTLETELQKGVHLIEATATDESGNTASDAVRVTVVLREEDGNGTGDEGIDPVFIVVMVILIVFALVIVVFLFIRNSNLRREWDETISGDATGGSKKPVSGRIDRGPAERKDPSRRREDSSRRRIPRDLPRIEDDHVGGRDRRWK